ncbi:MAG: helix-turn-helix domain-containing protein [Gammaproteobacteria bacterium]
MDDLRLLWINFTRSQTPPEVLRELGANFTVNWLPGGQALDESVLPSEPCITCFDFDDPSPEGLATLSEFKLRHPSIPILMLSLHHDTALVLWALRARVWNFFAKPIRSSDFIRDIEPLRKIIASKKQEPGRGIVRPGSMDARDPDEKKPTRSEWTIVKAKAYVDAHLADDIKASEVATHCAMSYFHFSRSFKRACGESFNDYVQRQRCRRAARLLENPNLNITRVCFDVGFKDVSYFARVFKQCQGTTPSAFRGGINAPESAIENLGQARIFAAGQMTSIGPEIPAHTAQKNPVAAQKYASRTRATRR